MDRKYESRALPSGFSSNLGRKATPGGKADAGKSVRSIVDWLERTTTTTRATRTTSAETREPRAVDDRNNADNHDRLSRSSKATQPDMVDALRSKDDLVKPYYSPPASPTHPEEYSLTLLRYKSYFNNRPLARCLDHKEIVDYPDASMTPKAASASSRYSDLTSDSIRTALREPTDGSDTGTPTASSPPMLKKQTRTRNTSNTCPANFKNTTSTSNDVSEAKSALSVDVVQRDPAQVKAF
jgi:hypothetical protein